jgi:hypothetical protein
MSWRENTHSVAPVALRYELSSAKTQRDKPLRLRVPAVSKYGVPAGDADPEFPAPPPYAPCLGFFERQLAIRGGWSGQRDFGKASYCDFLTPPVFDPRHS